MVKVFKFRDNLLKLEINGEKFEVDVFDKDFLEAYEPLQAEIETFQEDIKKGTKKKAAGTVKEMMELQVRAIDTFLGDGAVKRIIKDRKVNLLDLNDILMYINESRAAFTRETLEGKQAYSPNRAERRK